MPESLEPQQTLEQESGRFEAVATYLSDRRRKATALVAGVTMAVSSAGFVLAETSYADGPTGDTGATGDTNTGSTGSTGCAVDIFSKVPINGQCPEFVNNSDLYYCQEIITGDFGSSGQYQGIVDPKSEKFVYSVGSSTVKITLSAYLKIELWDGNAWDTNCVGVGTRPLAGTEIDESLFIASKKPTPTEVNGRYYRPIGSTATIDGDPSTAYDGQQNPSSTTVDSTLKLGFKLTRADLKRPNYILVGYQIISSAPPLSEQVPDSSGSYDNVQTMVSPLHTTPLTLKGQTMSSSHKTKK